MELSASPSDLALLRRFSPFDSMKPENLAALAKRTSRLQAPKGRLLFTEGDEEKQTYYLLSGTVDLMAEGEVIGQVRSGTPKAKNPLAHALPRPYSAVVTSDRIEYLHLDSEFLDVVVTWDQTGSYKVIELRDTVEEGAERRRLDDGAAADQGVPQGAAVEHPGGLHAHAARWTIAPAKSSSSRATPATTSTSS